jgi:hypothetical protein
MVGLERRWKVMHVRIEDNVSFPAETTVWASSVSLSTPFLPVGGHYSAGRGRLLGVLSPCVNRISRS